MQEDDLIMFTDEELAYAMTAASPSPKYYVYYKKNTGEIISVSNEINSAYEYGIEVESSVATPFITGEFKFTDFVVGIDNGTLSVISIEDEIFRRRTNLFEQISSVPTALESDLDVHWDESGKQWVFVISDNCRQQLKTSSIIVKGLVFFVTIESDLNFLIRTIVINPIDLISDKVCIPFTTNIEAQIDKIAISTKIVFSSYSLKIWKLNGKN
jgi:hypothetical protein